MTSGALGRGERSLFERWWLVIILLLCFIVFSSLPRFVGCSGVRVTSEAADDGVLTSLAMTSATRTDMRLCGEKKSSEKIRSNSLTSSRMNDLGRMGGDGGDVITRSGV